MAEFERHPQAARQGAAAIAIVAFTAAGMPAMAMRAEAQRDDADWAARSAAFNKYLAEVDAGAPAARLTFTVAPQANGWRAHAVGFAAANAFQRAAFTISPDLRDTSALSAMTSVQPEGLRNATVSAREQHCLAEAVYYEARGEAAVGQMAVAEVVMNRVHSPTYPKTVCGVVYQGSERSTGCQFSFTCDGATRSRPFGRAWREANAIATRTLSGLGQSFTHSATHYHANTVEPYWSGAMVETTRIGAHVFYRFPNRTEKAYLASVRRDASAAQEAADKTDGAVDDEAAPTKGDDGVGVVPPVQTPSAAPSELERTAGAEPRRATAPVADGFGA